MEATNTSTTSRVPLRLRLFNDAATSSQSERDSGTERTFRLPSPRIARRRNPNGDGSRASSRRTRTRSPPATSHRHIVVDEKPREERPYKEFHPELDLNMQMMLLEADEVDGYSSRPGKSAITGRGRPPRQVNSNVSNADNRKSLNDQLNKPVFKVIKRSRSVISDGLDDLPIGMADVAGTLTRDRFELPEEYIRSEKIDMEPDDPNTVEYDMDEQDDQFLIILNEERRKKYSATPISRLLFEVVMTMLEKEWFALQLRIPKTKPSVIDALNENDDSKCAICDDGECENSNAIVFCDGCNVAVHQDCYGVPFIPEGQWLCRRCQSGPRHNVSCIFCPNKSGAFKQTDRGHWAHLLCALWLPEISVGNMVYMEPVEGVDRVPRQRWKLVCYICKQKTGACIQCMNKSCFTAFHVSCARRAELQLHMRGSVAACLEEYEYLEAYCERHCSSEYRDEHDLRTTVAKAQAFYSSTLGTREYPDAQMSALSAATMADADELRRQELPRIKLNLSNLTASAAGLEEDDEGTKVVWKTNLGAPIIPHVIYKKICDRMNRYGIRKRKEFVSLMCRYWTLKKEIRRGATLLKRLQVALESMPDKDFTPEQEQKKLDFAKVLRKDLDQLITIVERVVAREAAMLDLAEVEMKAIDSIRLLNPSAANVPSNTVYQNTENVTA
ncbi:PHD-zinc-finger like domain-containing protein [Lipomyces tetrasporus]|uniref:PHD-zinc-finger like domain-containing protein n=1 Tax=Lipomyces tetrasporus TaxID=54092 RepID=A0AAD7VTI2_9ASCO|nr:PHD-zinc-finger like domain-containing protein [Lipomyces tetrasporus]KAJ8102127.1 PHD-zinc-finger like domain-containing protein [Lipomyces tetrasporus]